MLLTSTNKVGQISTAGDEKLQVKAIGDASLRVGEATIQLLDVLYVPKLNANLLSVQGLIKNGARVIFDEFGTTIKQNDGTQVQFKRDRRQGHFKVRGQALVLELEETRDGVPEDNQNTGKLDNAPEGNKDMKHQDSYLWHERFGHPGRDKTRQIRAHYLGTDEEMEHEGFTQREGIDYQETFSPVAPLGAIRAILALAVQNNWEVHALDITMAYLNSTLKEAIYMKLPEGSGVAPGKVYKVVKGLYGLKQSGREWNQEFDRSLRCMGFFQVECTPCIYTKGQGEDMAIVVIYVDDTLVIAPRLETVLKVKKQIGQRWKMEDSGYIDQVLAKHLDKRTKPTMVPMQSIPEGTLVASAAQQKEYPVIVGKLLWVANSTRPDLSLTVGVLARHMREPSQEHYQAAQRVLRYLESTRQVGLVYRASESQEPLVAHSDANWASDATIQRRSTSGSVALVYGNPVAWKSATQKCMSLSAVEAEFIAATEATCEVLFLKQLLCSIGIATGTPTVYSDNTGCIQVSKDPAQHWKLKHIDTKYHFVRNNVQEGRVQIKYVDTTINLADILTKPIGRQAMQQARTGLHLQIPAAVYRTGSPSYATVLKNGGHTLKQQHNEQGTYAVEGGS
ncbi:hypothetical protein NDA17_007503 [Ustilago hordei]|nr:hypothetical protein NDA17_007503 [Ustilago hordei]